MQEKELFINGESFYFLEQDEPIPYTLQVNDLGDLTSLYNNYTKQFKLPLTQRNKIILGFPDDVNVNTGLVYQENKAKLIVSGIEIIRNGKAEIQDTPNNCADVAILAGNCDFLDKLG